MTCPERHSEDILCTLLFLHRNHRHRIRAPREVIGTNPLPFPGARGQGGRQHEALDLLTAAGLSRWG